jgi:hypothetical protein
VHLVVPAQEFPDETRKVVAELLDAVDGTVGVITPAERRDAVAQWLPADPRLQVVDGMRAKGMEYDGVLVLAPDEIVAESPAGVRVLYVALTRATHRLVTIATAEDWRNGQVRG